MPGSDRFQFGEIKGLKCSVFFERNRWSTHLLPSANDVEVIHHVTGAASLTTFPVSQYRSPGGAGEVEVAGNNVWKRTGGALSDIIKLHLDTCLSFLVCWLLFLSSLRIISRLPREACIDNLNKVHVQFLLLFWSCNLLWITHVCCGGCHRSLPYKITIQLPVFARNWSFFSRSLSPLSLALVVSSASFDACVGKHQDMNLFGFFILRKDDVFFFVHTLLRILYLFSVPGWRKKKYSCYTCQANGNILVMCCKQVIAHLQCFPASLPRYICIFGYNYIYFS